LNRGLGHGDSDWYSRADNSGSLGHSGSTLLSGNVDGRGSLADCDGGRRSSWHGRDLADCDSAGRAGGSRCGDSLSAGGDRGTSSSGGANLDRTRDSGDDSRDGSAGSSAVAALGSELDGLALGGEASIGGVDVVDTEVVDKALVPNGAAVVVDDTSRVDGDASAGGEVQVALVLHGSTVDIAATASLICDGASSGVVAAEKRILE